MEETITIERMGYGSEAVGRLESGKAVFVEGGAPGDVAALEPITDRVLTRPATAWEAVSLLARAILGGGSVVFTESDGDPARTASAEKARVVA